MRGGGGMGERGEGLGVILLSLNNSEIVLQDSVTFHWKQNSDVGNFDFQIFGQAFINENCHNSRTSKDIDMKLRPAIKPDKRNTATTKKIDNDVMSVSCDVIITFLIYGQFRAIRKPDPNAWSVKLMFSSTVKFHLKFHLISPYLSRSAIFDISKILKVLVLKGI